MELKGFITTLESVFASSFLLFLALVAVSQLAADTQLESRETLQESLYTMRMSDRIPANPGQANSAMGSLVPPGLETRTVMSSYSTLTHHVDISPGTENVTVSAAAFAEAQLFVDSAPSLEVRFNGTRLSTASPGYQRVELPGYGNLTFDGTGDLTVAVRYYDQYRSAGDPQGPVTSSSSFMTTNGTQEVTFEAWQE
jgi:hypothetical protein